MWNKDNIYDELKEVAPSIAGIPNVNVYRVDEAYFNNLASNVLAAVGGEEKFSFEKTSKPSFSVPDGYFDNLAGSILNKIKAQESNQADNELAAIAPTLASIPKANVYTVPAGYFENFVFEKPAAKVVRFKAVKRVYTYAAAAVIFAIMAISAFLLFDKQPVRTSQAIDQNFAAAVSTLSDAELESYLGEQNMADASSPTIIIPDSDFDAKSLIHEVSEEELQIFLKENPVPANAPKQDS